ACFPQSETLVEFSHIKDLENPEKVALDVKETLPDSSWVVFGSRPCDARGFTMFDRVYLNGKHVDKGETTCFCNWVGSGPSDPTGSDVLMVPVDGGYFLEAVSDRGEALLSSSLLEDGGSKQADADKFR
ncbi:4Fe-4S dicluster domain-containing protein, partial [Aduncisulcus paluster]